MPNRKGPSTEARSRSAATRRRQADDRLAAQLAARGWLPVPPEIMEDLAGRPAEYIASVIGELWSLRKPLRDPIAHGGAHGMPCTPCAGPCQYPYK